jgi:sugar-specific transcriptional regulator TrmB
VADDPPFLDVPGLDPLSERVYLDLLENGRSNAAHASSMFGVSVSAASIILESLREMGLASRLDGEERDYTAVDPGYSLRVIADRMGDQVQRIRQTLPRLVDLFERVPVT